MSITNDDVIAQVRNIIENRFKRILPQGVESNDIKLTGQGIGFSAMDLAYLFFEIEKAFDIKINTDGILNYEFNTINSIADVIINNS